VARVRVAIARITEADDEAIDARRSVALEELRQTDQCLSPFM
jgi:hypothetical protein